MHGEISREHGRDNRNFTPYPCIRDQQAGMITALSVQPGRASTAGVQSNLIPPATGQSTRNQGRRNRSWSGSLFRMGLMLLFMFLSITATEGVKDSSEPTHQMYTPDCKLPPQMPIYMMPGKELFSFHKMEWNLTRNQGVCSIREGYVHKVRDTSLAGVCHKMALAMQEVLHDTNRLM